MNNVESRIVVEESCLILPTSCQNAKRRLRMHDPNLRALLLNAPDIVAFNKPMSKDARKLLEDMIIWGTNKASQLYKVPNPSLACIRDFAAQYQPIKFEEVCHYFELKTYIGIINKAYKPNKIENLLNVMLLKNLDDGNWVSEHSIQLKPLRVGSLTNEKTTQLYDWLTTFFVMTDFTAAEINKIAELSTEEFNFQVIKDAANGITNDEQKKISYLYAIVRDVTSRQQVAQGREHAMDIRYAEKLAKIMTYGGPKIQHDNPDRAEQWRREREWLEALKDIEEN